MVVKKSEEINKTKNSQKKKSSNQKNIMKKSVVKNSSSTEKSLNRNKGIVYNEKVFIENFVNLQHAMTNLSIKFGELSQNISKLLNVFEESAKILAKSEKQVDGQITNKIDSLLEQNKTIAKGLVLMEDQFKRQTRFSNAGSTPNQFEQHTTKPVVQSAPQPISNSTPNTNNISNEMSQQNSDKPKPLPQL